MANTIYSADADTELVAAAAELRTARAAVILANGGKPYSDNAMNQALAHLLNSAFDVVYAPVATSIQGAVAAAESLEVMQEVLTERANKTVLTDLAARLIADVRAVHATTSA